MGLMPSLMTPDQYHDLHYKRIMLIYEISPQISKEGLP